MTPFDLYGIYTLNENERGTVREMFLTFEDAKAARLKYQNAGSGAGDVYIERFVNGIYKMNQVWHITADGAVHELFEKKKGEYL